MNHSELIKTSMVELLLSKFEKINLEVLDSMKLIDRFDTKFVVASDLLPVILEFLSKNYKILDINGLRLFRYFNLYFDTDDALLYHQHHNGKLNRVKVRYRKYMDTKISFFEIKSRSNDGRTTKKRLQTETVTNRIEGKSDELINEKLGLDSSLLKPKLFVTYDRITLIDEMTSEKITIDMNLKFRNSVRSDSVSDVVFIEVKQRKVNLLSTSMQILRNMWLHSIPAMSKYCIGMVLTNSISKYNRFKPTIIAINKLNKRNYEFY